MEPGHEVETPATDTAPPLLLGAREGAAAVPDSPPPLATSTVSAVPSPPTPDAVLLWIVAADGSWFPSRFAAASDIPRDSLDEPLAELRLAGLVRVAEWVRGAGQGYVATLEGKLAAADAAALAQLGRLVSRAISTPSADAALSADEREKESVAETSEIPSLTTTRTEPNDTREDEVVLKPPVVVPVLLIANALWFFVCAVMSIRWGLTLTRALSESHPEILSRFGAVSGAELLRGEWWRLLTCCFLHIGLIHVVVNLTALAMMGALAELVWGRVRLVIIYFVSGLAGSTVAMAIHPDSQLAGASGAIWGIQMSLFAWLFTFRKQLPSDLAADWFRRLGLIFVVNVGFSFLPGVSWEAHFGGGAAGFLAAGLLNAIRFGDRPRRISSLILLIAMPALCVVGLWGAMNANGLASWQQLRQRLAADEDRAKLKRAQEVENAFNTNVAPRMPELAPEVVKPAESEAVFLLLRKTRQPERVAAVLTRLEALKKTAGELMALTSGDPVGFESFDKHRERVREAVATRAKALDLLLAMLDAKDVPTTAAWEAWGTARRDADRAWNAAKAK